MGGGSGSFLKVLVNNMDVLAGPLVSLAYPLYASVRAIETKSAVDDQQWLTYWVLYSFITLFELTFAPVLECRPDDVISAAQRYIEQNGSKAFENLVNKFKSSNPRRSILEEVEVERRARIQLESEAREVNPFFNPEYQY
ncbi:HVA22-like protein a [Zea mays]|uniref:HVA22-like protein n=2 Tax=Zea mays TaxID=4577 RepID=A0A8J8XJY3_MAIZE|nr:HVA22-like protein a [Zea mays]AQK74919.1 HVA22-like protein a [Zea mays]PWZ21089.1 hypothetical protein Zm00014a_000858 [Zea mays]PWZ21090.1 HVA22-like protein a [Zea mays]